MRPCLIPFAVLLLAPFVAAGPVAAQPQGADSQRTQPLDRLLPEIRRNHPGQFLDAEGITRNGAPGYRLKWLTPDGRVISMDTDARTGRVMGGAPDRGQQQREGFSRGEDGLPPERTRPNFQQNFDGARGDDARARFGNRGFPQRDNQDRQERFSRPGARPGDGGFGNRGDRFGGRGENGPARGFGNGRSRGRGGEN